MKSSSVRERVSQAEWETRVNLAACYRLVARYGMADLIYNHVTARVPGEDGRFLITPFGFMYEEITASSLFKIDVDGNVIERPDVPYDINHAGYVIHSAIHNARHDLSCVVHTHTPGRGLRSRRSSAGCCRPPSARCASTTASRTTSSRVPRSTRASAPDWSPA